MYIKFTNLPSPVEGSVSVTGNIATLKFKETPTVSTSGFKCYLDKKMEHDISGDSYIGFTTMYRNDEETAKYNGYQLSDDGSVYVEPVYTTTFSAGSGGDISGEKEQAVKRYEELLIPTPMPGENYEFEKWNPEIPEEGDIKSNQTFTAVFTYVPTLDEIKEQKVVEMNAVQQELIQKGVDVHLSDGSVEHFTLTDHDQISLMGLQTRVIAGDPLIPWHTSDQGENCKYYSNADMALITEKAMGFVTFEVTRFRDLRIYIRSLQTKEEVKAITYNTVIPNEYQSQVLKDLMALMQ